MLAYGLTVELRLSPRFRYARKDKRPLDPPPVVQVRFFEVLNGGTAGQQEKEVLTYE